MRLADRIAESVGSWKFIASQSLFLVLYVSWNSLAPIDYRFDPYPFVFLNLILSFQAAYTAPIIMISQNRMAASDRKMAREDHKRNEVILKSIQRLEKKLLDKIEDLEEEMHDDSE